MVFIAFLLGFFCGLSVLGLRAVFKNGFSLPLGEDEKYLLAAARAAEGHLVLRLDSGTSGTSLLLLKEFPNPRRLENTLQIETLLARKFLQPDVSGLPGQYTLTPLGWTRSQKLPAFPLQRLRPGASWFNSVSLKSGRLGRRKKPA